MSKEEEAANLLIDWLLDHPEASPLGGRARALDVLNAIRGEVEEIEK